MPDGIPADSAAMTLLFSVVSAGWVGILTSISPCPLATNVAAISYLAKHVGKPILAVERGLVYMLGRSTAYIVLAGIFVKSAYASPRLAQGIQQTMSILIGPLLIIVALFLLEIVRFSNLSLAKPSDKFQRWAERSGSVGAFALGFVFALTFCPVSAGLFFGTLIPIALQQGSVLLVPVTYGVGTALPVMAFGVAVLFSARHVGRIFNVLTHIEKYARYVTALVFLLVGLYLIWRAWPLYLQWFS